jgi:hypothetical protein
MAETMKRFIEGEESCQTALAIDRRFLGRQPMY